MRGAVYRGGKCAECDHGLDGNGWVIYLDADPEKVPRCMLCAFNWTYDWNKAQKATKGESP